jgi:hypothetical protein
MSQGARIAVFICAFIPLLLTGCQTTYYAVWEKMGKEKRHLLKDQVEKVRTDQEEASQQFEDVLTRIKEIYGFDGGDLEKAYKSLKSDYETCEARANDVSERIEKVQTVAADLFAEWAQEIEEINNSKLKYKSKSALRAAQKRFERFDESVVKAEAGMQPVLSNLKDYVYFLKHNLNAMAVGTLKAEAGDIEMEIKALIEDMTRSIKEAEAYADTL